MNTVEHKKGLISNVELSNEEFKSALKEVVKKLDKKGNCIAKPNDESIGYNCRVKNQKALINTSISENGLMTIIHSEGVNPKLSKKLCMKVLDLFLSNKNETVTDPAEDIELVSDSSEEVETTDIDIPSAIIDLTKLIPNTMNLCTNWVMKLFKLTFEVDIEKSYRRYDLSMLVIYLESYILDVLNNLSGGKRIFRKSTNSEENMSFVCNPKISDMVKSEITRRRLLELYHMIIDLEYFVSLNRSGGDQYPIFDDPKFRRSAFDDAIILVENLAQSIKISA